MLPTEMLLISSSTLDGISCRVTGCILTILRIFSVVFFNILSYQNIGKRMTYLVYVVMTLTLRLTSHPGFDEPADGILKPPIHDPTDTVCVQVQYFSFRQSSIETVAFLFWLIYY